LLSIVPDDVTWMASPDAVERVMSAPLDSLRAGDYDSGELDEVAYHPPEFERGDYIEFRAEMDLIVGISACPNDTTEMNEYEPKPLTIQVDNEPTE
jgi:hypothetical protein